MNPLFGHAVEFVSDTVHRFYGGKEIDRVVERFADDATLAPAMGERLRKLVEDEFSWEATATKVRAACVKANG